MALEKLLQIHTDIFSRDLGANLAVPFVTNLYQEISQGKMMTEDEILCKGDEIFHNLAKNTYGPLMVSFVDWCLQKYSVREDKSNVIFLARDATPLYEIAKLLVQENDYDLPEEKLKLLYYTRAVAGEADEIAGFSSHPYNRKMLMQYFQETGLDRNSLLIDMGLYGSLYNKGCNELWDSKPSLIFLYSKNPNILGYLNLQCGEYNGGMSPDLYDIANKIVDGCECVNPQQYWSPRTLENVNGQIRPKLVEIPDRHIQSWSRSTLEGYRTATSNFLQSSFVDVKSELSRLQKLSEMSAVGIWTGVLPNITPEWSLKDNFLRNSPLYKELTGKFGWSCGLAPPMGDIDGTYQT